MSTHIEAKKGEIAENVLLPGDPMRAKWIAENFLEMHSHFCSRYGTGNTFYAYLLSRVD